MKITSRQMMHVTTFITMVAVMLFILLHQMNVHGKSGILQFLTVRKVVIDGHEYFQPRFGYSSALTHSESCKCKTKGENK